MMRVQVDSRTIEKPLGVTSRVGALVPEIRLSATEIRPDMTLISQHEIYDSDVHACSTTSLASQAHQVASVGSRLQSLLDKVR